MATQTLSTFTIENKEYYEKVLLDRMLDTLYFYTFAQKSVYPKHSGNIMTWRVIKSLEVPTASLTEGVTPSPSNLSIVQFKATLKQEGSFVELSDIIDLEGKDPIVTETAEVLGEQAAQRLENIIIGKITTGLNVYYAGGATSTATVGSGTKSISIADLNNIKAVLKKRNAKPYENGKYILVIDTDVEKDLKNLTGANSSWLDLEKYNSKEKIEQGEVGSFLGFKIIVSNQIPTDGTTTSVRKCLAFGKDAFGVVELEGSGANKPNIIYKGKGSAGTADPLDQRQTLGWNVPGFTCRILHDESLVRYEVYSASSTLSAFTDSSRSNYDTANTAA